MNAISKDERNKINDLIKKILKKEQNIDYNEEFYKIKIKQLESFINRDHFNEKDFREIQILSSSKGGFLNNDFRVNIWKKILSAQGINKIFEFIVLADDKDKSSKSSVFDKIYVENNNNCKTSFN